MTRPFTMFADVAAFLLLLHVRYQQVSEVPDHNVSAAVLLHCLVEAVALTDEFSPNVSDAAVALEAHTTPRQVEEEEEEVLAGPLGPGFISLDHGDACGLRVALTELILSDGALHRFF